MSRPDVIGAAFRAMLRGVHLASPEDLPALAQAAGRELGADETVIYVVDYDQVVLIPLMPEESRERVVPIEGTVAGRAFSKTTLVSVNGRDRRTVWAPLLDGTDRLGVLEFRFGHGAQADEASLEGCRWVSSLLAELVITRSQYGDTVERIRRRKPMSLSAELQWSQLPPLTFVTPRVAIAGVLAPTEDVAGDSFDYAVNGETAHVAVVDAMGHGLDAALMSALAIGQLRNSRRSGSSLVDTAMAMDHAIARRFGPDRFVTAVVGQLDTSLGVWTWINCGHPASLIVRGGHVVKKLDLPVNPPLGLLSDDPEISTERLEPGDRIVLYTDGVTDARDTSGNFFGVERLVDFVTRHSTAGRPAAETLRRLNLAILRHQSGVLQDDATTVLVEWLSDEPLRSRLTVTEPAQ